MTRSWLDNELVRAESRKDLSWVGLVCLVLRMALSLQLGGEDRENPRNPAPCRSSGHNVWAIGSVVSRKGI